MLRTPYSSPAIHFDLTFQDATDPTLNCLLALGMHILWNKRKSLAIEQNISHQAHHTNHGIVIEGDMFCIPPWLRETLRPATIVVLCSKQVGDTLDRSISKTIVGSLFIGISQ